MKGIAVFLGQVGQKRKHQTVDYMVAAVSCATSVPDKPLHCKHPTIIRTKILDQHASEGTPCCTSNSVMRHALKTERVPTCKACCTA